MSTMEHLFMQIFERKNRIEDQLKHQIESYGESLAYNLLADGERPPSWLWTTGSDGCGCPDPKGLNRGQLISGIFFPLPRATTPSANHSNFFTLPALKDDKISQSNKFTETCASNKYIYAKHSDKALPSPCVLTMVESKVVESCAEFDPLARIQRSKSRQRDLEIRLIEKEKSTSHFRESTMEEYTGRLTRSRVASVKADNGDGGRVNQSRSRFTDQNLCLDKLSKPPKPLNCVEDGTHEATESQTDIRPVPSVNLANHACNNMDDIVAPHTCTTGTVAKELVLDAACPAHSSLNMSSAVASMLPDTFPLGELKKLLFYGIEECGLNENSCIPSEKKNQSSSSEVALTKSEAVQSVKKDMLCRDLEKVHVSEKEQHRVGEADRVSKGGAEEDGLELLEVEDSECHSHPTSGHQSVQHDVSRKSSFGSLVNYTVEEQCSIKLKNVLMCGVACSHLETNFLVEPKHLVFDSIKVSGLNNSSVAALEKETKSSSSDIAFTELEALQPLKEPFCSHSDRSHASSANRQLQVEDVLPTVEVIGSTEEANIVLGRVLEGRLELSEALESESISHLTSNNKHFSHIPALSSLKVRCGSSENSPTPLVVDCMLNSDLDFSGDRIAMPDASKKRSLGTPVHWTMEEKHTEKLIEEKNSSPFQLINTVRNDGSVLFIPGPEEMLLEDEEIETSAVEVVKKSFVQSTLTPMAAGNHNTVPEFQHMLRNSSGNGRISGSCKSIGSVLPSSNKADESLSARETMGNGSTKGVEAFIVGKISNTAESFSAQPKVRYFLRSSTSLGPKDVAENSVNHHTNTPNSVETQNAPPKARYFLRSLTGHDKNAASFRSNASNYVNSLKQSMETIAHTCEISWPKRRKMEYRSNNILATSPRLRSKHFLNIQEGGDCSCKIEKAPGTDYQPIPLSTETETGISNAASESPLELLHESKKLSMMEQFRSIEHTQEEPFSDLADGNSRICFTDEARVPESTIHKPKEHCASEDGQDLPCAGNTLKHEIPKRPSSCEGFTKDREQYDTDISLHTHDTASLSHYDDDVVGFDETMPEFEGFSIGVPSIMEDAIIFNDSDLPSLTKQRASVLEQLRKSWNMLTPTSHLSSKYKIHKVPDVYQSLPAGLLEHMNLSCSLQFNDEDLKQFRESDDDKIAGLYGNSGSQFDGSFVRRPYSHSMPSSSIRVEREGRKLPLTPPIMKFGQKVVSGRSGASSEKVGGNPELICFRIDENSSTSEENEHLDELGTSKEGVVSRGNKDSTNRKTLVDVTAEYQNAPAFVFESKKFLDRGSVESVNSESYFKTQLSTHSSLENGYASNRDFKEVDKENVSLSVNGNRVRKASASLRSRSSKARISRKTSEKNRSQGNLEKGCKPNNIISNISSFIPLVHQKQQAAAPVKGKKDIKVKALEAAEAAKRLEEKKQNDREMRKAMVKLERERLEQENIRQLEQNKKQKEEERKKKEADIAARKRQREEEGRKEKERKRRCIEETRRQQKEQEEKQRAEKVEKELQRKASDEMESRKKELVEEAKRQLKLEKGGEVAGCQKAADVQPCTTKVLAVNARNGSNILEAPDDFKKLNDIEKVVSNSDGLQEAIHITATKESRDLQSYEMSPYKDSDDEDGEEESRRERKCIPLWARGECLNQYILSKQHLDPTKVFCCKRSFNLSKVLSTHILRRPF